jgi:hypothetical protein
MVKKNNKTVLFYDHNWSHIERLVRQFSTLVQGLDIYVILLSDRKPSEIKDNLEIINIYDVTQKMTLIDMQKKFRNSLHKALIGERAFYDYSSFRRSQCYSRLSEEQIAETISPYVNGLEYVIRERADLIIEWWPDNFLSSVAQMIATEYKKPFAVFLPHYWWKDGALIIDRMNMTSQVIDDNYKYFFANPDLLDMEKLKKVYSKKVSLFFFKQNKMYRLKDRLQLIVNRQKSYQPVSIRNWTVRRTSTFISSILIKICIPMERAPRDEAFVIYPLHISPEAALLGTVPELADQFSLIKNISMNLPFGVKLYVKQHPFEHLGLGLDYDFYRRLSALPNVRIFDKKSNLNQILESSGFLAMVVLAGTAAIDAALQRKPIFVFGQTYYSIAECFIKPKSFQDFYYQLRSIMQGNFQFHDRALNAMIGALDKSVVRADIDLTSKDNLTDVASQLPYIWRSYVESQMLKREVFLNRPGF